MWQRCLLSLWDGTPALWECVEKEGVSVRKTEHKGSRDLTLALSSGQELASSLEKSINPFFKRLLKLALCSFQSKRILVSHPSHPPQPSASLEALPVFTHTLTHTYSYMNSYVSGWSLCIERTCGVFFWFGYLIFVFLSLGNLT